MKLTDTQIKEFETEGYLFLPNVFSAEEMALLTAEIPGLFAQNLSQQVAEQLDAVTERFTVEGLFFHVFRLL